MSELNNLQLQGTVTQPGTFQKSESGVNYCSFSIVTNISKKQNDGQYINEPHYFPVALFGAYAESMGKYLTKGRRLILEGYLRQTHWEKDGQKMSGIGIGVNKLHLIFERKDKNNVQVSSNEETASSDNYYAGEIPEEALNQYFDGNQEIY